MNEQPVFDNQIGVTFYANRWRVGQVVGPDGDQWRITRIVRCNPSPESPRESFKVYGVRPVVESVPPAIPHEPEAQMKAMAQVCLDLHAALGVPWGGDPYAKILELQESAAPLREPPIPRDWQPIATAPKDGREVLLAVKLRAGMRHCCLVGHYMPGGHCIEDHPPIAPGWYFWNGCMFDGASEPTHWMPLPAARGEL